VTRSETGRNRLQNPSNNHPKSSTGAEANVRARADCNDILWAFFVRSASCLDDQAPVRGDSRVTQCSCEARQLNQNMTEPNRLNS
jgi:hypothetical protein